MSTVFTKHQATADDQVPDNYRELILDNFPYEVPYPGQLGIIYDIIKAYVDGCPYVVLNAGTGTGKSVIAVTVCNILSKYEASSRIITKTRLLQKQYEDSLGGHVPGLKILWGKIHYSDVPYGYDKKVYKCGKSCPGMTYHHTNQECTWAIAKAAYLGSKIGVTNNAMYIGSPFFRTSGVLVVDECHNIPEDLIEVSSFSYSAANIIDEIKHYKLDEEIEGMEFLGMEVINTSYLQACKEYESKIPEGVINYQSIIQHLNRISIHVNSKILPHFTKLASRYEQLAEQYPTDQNLKEYERISDVVNRLVRLVGNAKNVNFNDYCIESQYHYDNEENVTGYSIVCTPYEPASHVCKILNSNFLILMSATTGDYTLLSKSLHLDPLKGRFIDAPTTFLVDNRKVHLLNVARINHKNINALLAFNGNVTTKVHEIMTSHSGQRGLIHSVSYYNGRLLIESMKQINPSLAERMVLVESGTQINPDYILSYPNDTVFVSPSATEGVDLKDDLARFQVILKIPFGYLGDNYVYCKSEMNPDWYRDQAARIVLQMAGRIVRSNVDWGSTYIMDTNYDKLDAFIPSWFKVAEVKYD